MASGGANEWDIDNDEMGEIGIDFQNDSEYNEVELGCDVTSHSPEDPSSPDMRMIKDEIKNCNIHSDDPDTDVHKSESQINAKQDNETPSGSPIPTAPSVSPPKDFQHVDETIESTCGREYHSAVSAAEDVFDQSSMQTAFHDKAPSTAEYGISSLNYKSKQTTPEEKSHPRVTPERDALESIQAEFQRASPRDKKGELETYLHARSSLSPNTLKNEELRRSSESNARRIMDDIQETVNKEFQHVTGSHRSEGGSPRDSSGLQDWFDPTYLDQSAKRHSPTSSPAAVGSSSASRSRNSTLLFGFDENVSESSAKETEVLRQVSDSERINDDKFSSDYSSSAIGKVDQRDSLITERRSHPQRYPASGARPEEFEEDRKVSVFVHFNDIKTPVTWWQDTPKRDVKEAILCACDAIADSGVQLRELLELSPEEHAKLKAAGEDRPGGRLILLKMKDESAWFCRGRIYEFEDFDQLVPDRLYSLELANERAELMNIIGNRWRCLTVEIDPFLHVETQMAISVMKTGTNLMKHTSFGYPHLRQFQLTPDCKRIVWYSAAKSRETSQVFISKILEIKIGQQTTNFKQYPIPGLANLSFSIICARDVSIDLTAKNESEFTSWVTGLKALCYWSRNRLINKFTLLGHCKKFRQFMSERDPAFKAAEDRARAEETGRYIDSIEKYVELPLHTRKELIAKLDKLTKRYSSADANAASLDAQIEEMKAEGSLPSASKESVSKETTHQESNNTSCASTVGTVADSTPAAVNSLAHAFINTEIDDVSMEMSRLVDLLDYVRGLLKQVHDLLTPPVDYEDNTQQSPIRQAPVVENTLKREAVSADLLGNDESMQSCLTARSRDVLARTSESLPGSKQDSNDDPLTDLSASDVSAVVLGRNRRTKIKEKLAQQTNGDSERDPPDSFAGEDGKDNMRAGNGMGRSPKRDPGMKKRVKNHQEEDSTNEESSQLRTCNQLLWKVEVDIENIEDMATRLSRVLNKGQKGISAFELMDPQNIQMKFSELNNQISGEWTKWSTSVRGFFDKTIAAGIAATANFDR